MTKTEAPIRPATVSAALKRAGVTTVSPSDHNREGIKVTRGHNDRHVAVNVDINVESVAIRRAALVREALEDLGYVVEANPQDAALLTVTKRG